MHIKLVLDQSFSAGKITSCTVPIESEEDILIDCIRSVVGENCCISFCNYYSNANLMNFERMFPFIIKDGVANWYVPFDKVSIGDFRKTHHLGPEDAIHAEIEAYGGAGDDFSEIISWIVDNWETINNGIDMLSSSIKIGNFVQKIYKYFSNGKHRIPLFRDVEESIWEQNKWDSNELMKQLKVPDLEFLDYILHSAGYERIENTYHKKSDDVDSQETNYEIDCIWGKSACNSLISVLTQRIQELNILLTDIKFRVENLDLDIFDKMEDYINELIVKWEPYLNTGENLCFIMLTDLPHKYDLVDLEEDVDRLYSYTRDLINRITEIEAKGERALQYEIEWPVYDADESEQEGEVEDEYLVDQLDEDDDRYVSPWEPLIVKLYLTDSLVEITTDSETLIGYLEQIYDDDVLLQVLSEKGQFIEYRTINIYDIQIVSTDTGNLRSIAKKTPKEKLPSLPTYGISAKQYLVDFAAENDAVLFIDLNDLQESPLKVKVETVCDTDYSNESIVKLRLMSDKGKEDGVAWIEMDAINWIRST